MGDAAIGGIGIGIPNTAVSAQFSPLAVGRAAMPLPPNTPGLAASVIVNFSEAAWRALALEAAGAAVPASSQTLNDLALVALLALLAQRQDGTTSVSAAAAIETYLLIQALG